MAGYKRAVFKARLKTAKAKYFALSDYYTTIAELAKLNKDKPDPFPKQKWQDLLVDVEFARLEMAGTGTEDAERIVRFTTTRSYGLHGVTIEKTAAWATRVLGKNVTPRAVERAWKLVRSAHTAEG